MKSYKLFFNEDIEPFIKSDIENCMETKLGFKQSENPLIEYKIIITDKITQLFKYSQLRKTEIPIKTMLWESFIPYLPKHDKACLIPTTNHLDIVISLSSKTGIDFLEDYHNLNDCYYNEFCFIGDGWYDENYIKNLNCSLYTTNSVNNSIYLKKLFTHKPNCDMIYHSNGIIVNMEEVIVQCMYNDFYDIGK